MVRVTETANINIKFVEYKGTYIMFRSYTVYSPLIPSFEKSTLHQNFLVRKIPFS